MATLIVQIDTVRWNNDTPALEYAAHAQDLTGHGPAAYSGQISVNGLDSEASINSKIVADVEGQAEAEWSLSFGALDRRWVFGMVGL